eukprot:6000932-Amphidinium_carterae.1
MIDQSHLPEWTVQECIELLTTLMVLQLDSSQFVLAVSRDVISTHVAQALFQDGTRQSAFISSSQRALGN